MPFHSDNDNAVFRDQDFARLPIEKALEFGGYFGRHHIHQTSSAPKGFPQIHLVHRGADDRTGSQFLEAHTNSVTWHSDVTFEKQPPGTTFLYLLDGPTTGGDTLFANTALAYQRLSPEFRKRLHGLKAVHSGIEQAESSLARGGIVRREPITSEHPIVRTHPVTGEKALFVNPQCKSSPLWYTSRRDVPNIEQSPAGSSDSRRRSPTSCSSSSSTTSLWRRTCKCV